jgi:hypothetical protein
MGFRADVIKQIEQYKPLSPELRRKALALAHHRNEDPNQLNNLSWHMAARPDATPTEYASAVRQAKAAISLAPENTDYLNTLGVAQYRACMYQDAIAT